jgi:signal transduction histidine kinase
MGHADPVTRLWDRLRVGGVVRAITAAGMAVFVVLTYLVVVIGGGTLIGRRGSPSVWLSVLATAVVALAFEPVRVRLKGKTARLIHQDRRTPYQVLARFPSTVTGFYPSEELPARMAKVLVEGTDTARAEVWLAVHGRLELAACWPPDAGSDSSSPAAPPPFDDDPVPARDVDVGSPGPSVAAVGIGPRQRSLQVREHGELLGALSVVLRDGQQLTPVEERLFAGLAAQSALALRTAGLREELEQRLAELEQRAEDVRAARRNLVARQDAERQRLERNIHDGAQQRLIALLVSLRLTQTMLSRSPDRAGKLLADQADAATGTIETLDALARGLYPSLLTEAGPEAALRAMAQLSPIPVTVTATQLRRYPSQVEATVYFCCLEAVQNASKHSAATAITIDLQGRADGIAFTVADDGRGFVPERSTGGLANMRDRVESLQGTLTVESAPGRGTAIRASVPLSPPTEATGASRSPARQAFSTIGG